ncbi:sigma 54-interacting transcriptional regulator [Candidatus Deferrimicrobium sp.]|uniref:sigma 54-interacting transcriptional regulator n=1 Tax=Candidatus Deferrimicrobium sp. TaxID=3060586 RepID=UPI002ED01E73
MQGDSEAILCRVLDSMTNGVIAIDREGTIFVFNDAAARLLHVGKEDALGKRLLDIVPNSGLVSVLRTGAPETGRPQQIGARSVIADRAPIFRDGELIGAVSVFQDVTEMEKMSRELDSTRALARTLEEVLAGAGEWMVVVDANGIVTMISEEYAEFNGTTVADAVGKHVTQVIENTRMHTVVKTGTAEIGERMTIRGRALIVNRIPLKDGDRVIGAYGRVVFKTVEQLRELASKMNLLESKVKYYEEELTHLRGARYTFGSIVGAGAAITAAKAEAERASRTDSTVLLRGETGTGKELFAHAIHAAGPRRAGPFIKLNCAAVPTELLESELFGYEEGAFTGARRGGKPGKFELAAGGTLFLDEIGDMPLPMQAKLLRVLQEKEVDRLGGTGSRRVDLRLIAATARNLEEMVGQGTFRADLYYRVNVIPIRIPPLREHWEDLGAIAESFLARLSADTGEPKRRLSAELLEVLRTYPWPGNVRELQNGLERAVAMSPREVLRPEHFPAHLLRFGPGVRKESIPAPAGMEGEDTSANAPGSLASVKAEAERSAILSALAAAGGNRTRAAELLGIHRVKLHEKIKRYGIASSSERQK